jgi:hypothetical protein
MTTPSTDTLQNYGGALSDYSPPIDSTTDRPAQGANQAYASTAMMTHTAVKCFTCLAPAGTGTPVLASSGTQYDAQWLAATNTAPVLARSGTGTYTQTWPATVQDEIPSNYPGATSGGHALNLRRGWANCEPGSTTRYDTTVTCSANVVTLKVYTAGTSTLVDPNDGTVFDVYAV